MKESDSIFMTHVAARSKALPVLVALCAKGGYQQPVLNVVDALPGGDIHTAQTSSVRGAGVIDLPHNLTTTLSLHALESLLGHELAHIIKKKSLTSLLRYALMLSFVGLGMAAILVVPIGVFTQIGFLSNIAPLVLFCLALISFFASMAFTRKHESECDVFALHLTGNVAGALEHLSSYSARETSGTRRTLWESLIAHHPTPHRRLIRIQEEAARSSAARTPTPP